MHTQPKRGRTGRILRRCGIALSALAAASLAATPVAANVGNELNDFFNDMGASANATGPVAYQGQSAVRTELTPVEFVRACWWYVGQVVG